MEFDGTEGGFISMEEATTMTGAYKRNNPEAIHGYFFGREKLLELLNQEGAMGIRIHYGHDADGNNQLVLLAADRNMNNMEGLILDLGSPCPAFCSPSGKP